MLHRQILKDQTPFLTTTIDYDDLVNDLNFKRYHPMYSEWSDWKEIAHRYHSQDVQFASKSISKGKHPYENFYQQNKLHGWIADEVYWKKRDHIRKIANGYETWEKQFENPLPRVNHFDCENCYNFPRNTRYDPGVMKGCRFYKYHMQSHYISLLWAYVDLNKPRRSCRRYYKQLERVILALNVRQLETFSLDLITSPPKYAGRGRFLLRELYERAYFDSFKLNSFVERIEYLKNFIPKEQSGVVSQSKNDTDDFQEMLNLFLQLDQNLTLEQMLYPRQQGVFSVDHNVNFTESTLGKIRGIVTDSQNKFIKGMKDAILDSGKNLFVMFCIASTVCLVAKVAVGVSLAVILRLLHFIYGTVAGQDNQRFVQESYAAVQQSGSDITIPFLPSMILKYVISPPQQVLEKLWSNPNLDRVLRRIGHLGDPKIEKGIERLVDWMRFLIMRTRAWFYSEVLGVEIPEDLDGMNHAIVQWNEEVDDLIKSYYGETFVWSETTWSVVYNLYSRGLGFTRSQAYVKYKSDIWKYVVKLGNILEKFKQHARGSSIRNPPVTVYLAGGTGVGKSSVTYPLAAEILKGIFEKEESPVDLKRCWKELIYMRSSEQEFWDGYENQLVTVFDDFNQQADSASNPNLELFEVIRASNCFPYPLHMAALEQKANTTFTSKIILVSSNLERPKTQSLNFPEALRRRFDICIRVSRRQDVQVGNEFDPTIYKFEQYNMETGATIGFLTYQELVDLSTGMYFKRRSFVDSVENYISEKLSVDVPPPLPESDPPLIDVIDPMMPEIQVDIDKRNFTPIALLHPNVVLQQGGFVPITPEATWWQRQKFWLDEQASKLALVASAWWNTDPFFELKCCVDRMKLRYKELKSQYQEWRLQHPYLSKLVLSISLILAGLAFLKTFSLISSVVMGKKTDFMEPKAFAEGYSTAGVRNARSVRAEAYSAKMQKVVKVESQVFDPETGLPKAQGVKDLNAAEILMSVARRNLYKMYESTCGVALGHVLFLRGKICLMPKHYLSGLNQALRNDENAIVHFEAALLNRAFEVKIKDLLANIQTFESPEEREGEIPYSRDLMATVVSSAIVHPDCVPYFAARDSLSRVDSCDLVLPVLLKNTMANSERGILVLRHTEGRSALQRVESLAIGNETGVVVRKIRDAWRYNMDTQATECGSPLIVRNTEVQPGKMCGIHIAGLDGTGQGFASPLYKEDVLAILKQFSEKDQFIQVVRQNLLPYPKEQGQIPSSAEVIRLGKLSRPVAQPMATKIEPSLCHATYKDPTTRPCALRPVDVDGQKFDPRKFRIERLGNVPSAVNTEVINNAYNAFVDEISEVIAQSSDKMDNRVKAKYTFEETILGIEGDQYLNSVKRDTSPGFPFIHIPGQTTRKAFFGTGMDYDLSSKECSLLKQRVENIIENAKRGIVLDHYFVDTLKDERKPAHKAHKTRLFSAGPLDYLVACKMYFSGPCALVQHNRNWSHISVGTNPYSQDWTEIARTLLNKSENIVAGDFEGFDASQHQYVLEKSGEVLIALSRKFLKATLEDIKVMRVLLASLLCSFHITGDEVYQWTHSLPSGHYLTAMINSIFVNLSFCAAWQIAYSEFTYMFARTFWKECGIVAYGDDHLVSIPNSRLGLFNQLVLPGVFQQLGLSYTMEDKDAVAETPSRSLTEVSYLKRRFKWDKTRAQWLAPLDLEVILETPMWLHKCPDRKAQTIENLEWALKELSLHDREKWDYWSPVLRREEERLGFFSTLCVKADVERVCLSQNTFM